MPCTTIDLPGVRAIVCTRGWRPRTLRAALHRLTHAQAADLHASGFAGLQVVNLFAFRATKPVDLQRAGWPVGPDNDSHIAAAACAASVGRDRDGAG